MKPWEGQEPDMKIGVSDTYVKYDFLIKRFFIHNGQTIYDLPGSSRLYH
jgi:hypothetical protein